MPFTLAMPKLSPTMEVGLIAKWHKKQGDYVEADELLFEVATDKATVEYHALDAGWLRKVLVEEGKEAKVNQAVAIFTEEKEESIENYQPKAAAPASQETQAPLPEEKAQEGKEEKEEKGSALVQQVIFIPEPPLQNYRFISPLERAQERIKASPLARKLAKERNLDLSAIKGTGPSGRIIARDIENAEPLPTAVFSRSKKPTIPPGTYEEEWLTPMRRTIAKRLGDAKASIPHFYVRQEINAAALVNLREQLLHGEVKISYNDLIIRASALALRSHPLINSGFNSASSSLIRFKTIDIAVAVSLPTGLITPIIRHADYKSIGEISMEMRMLAKRAKSGKLEPTEYKGGSFTISNLGMYAIADFQAIINPPQAAILAVGAILDRPIVSQGQLVAGKTMALTLSVDHRAIDGVAAAQFLNTLSSYLEHPALLLLSD